MDLRPRALPPAQPPLRRVFLAPQHPSCLSSGQALGEGMQETGPPGLQTGPGAQPSPPQGEHSRCAVEISFHPGSAA